MMETGAFLWRKASMMVAIVPNLQWNLAANRAHNYRRMTMEDDEND